MLPVVLTKRAESSLEEITDYYLREHSADRAVKVVGSISKAFNNITSNPRSFPVCYDIKKPDENIRQAIVHSTFKIVFRIQKDKIEVLEIFHAKQNPKKLKAVK